MKLKLVSINLIMIIISSLAFGGTVDPNTNDSKYLEYGEKFYYVLKLEGKSPKDEVVWASCVIINNRWIVTAAHVMKEMETCNVKYNNKLIPIDKIIMHQDFNSNEFGIADIAICHLSEDINLDFYPELYEKNDEIDQICCMAGFGVTGTFHTGSKSGDGSRRAGSNKIEGIENDLLLCSPSDGDRKTALEFLIAHGDSGGGLFIDNRLAGINSCVFTTDGRPNSSYGDTSGHTRISKYNKWIKGCINVYSK